MHQYRAYDLGISSSLFLPELIAAAEIKEDIIIRMGGGEEAAEIDPRPELPYSVTIDKARLTFSEVGTFFIDGGRSITVYPLPNTEDRLIRLPLLGASLAVLLYQRGNFVLHASAVEINGEAVVFVGNKGDGKSTLAAMLNGRGHRLISDDTVAVDLEGDDLPMVLPGFPQFKLYPDSVIATMRDDPAELEEIASQVDKRSKRAVRFCEKVTPLKAVYVLGRGEQFRLSRLNLQEAVRFLIAHSYMARFSSDWLQNGIAQSNLRQCAAVAGKVPVYLLERPRDLSLLDGTARVIEESIRTARS